MRSQGQAPSAVPDRDEHLRTLRYEGSDPSVLVVARLAVARERTARSHERHRALSVSRHTSGTSADESQNLTEPRARRSRRP